MEYCGSHGTSKWYVQILWLQVAPSSLAWRYDVHMKRGHAVSRWLSSLSAFWPALQAAAGQLYEAEGTMANYTAAFAAHGWLPERFLDTLDTVRPYPVILLAADSVHFTVRQSQ